MRIRGQAAIDTSYISDLEITSSPAVAAGYATGETLEATVTFSEAVTVDTTTAPTLKVVIGSNTRTMTYNATSSSTGLQFDYTVVAADKDGNGASFNEDALTGTITRTSDSKAADLDHAAVADDSRARVNMPPAVTVSFGSATYSVDEGDGVWVTVTLSAAPQRNLTIPLTASFRGGATAADFLADNKTEVAFESDETSLRFSYRTEGDEVADHGESVRLSFGTLPTGVTASGTTTTTITIIDDDPAVTVDIEGDSGTTFASVAEGESVEVTVRLNKNAMRPLTIPITATTLDGASAADYTLSATSVTIASGETSGTLTLTATDDTDEDHGERVRLTMGTKPPGVTLLSQNSVTVSIADNDPAVTVSFRDSTHRVAENDSNTLRVVAQLSEAPKRPVSISLTVTYGGGATAADHHTIIQTLSFGANDTSANTPFNVTNDMIADDGETIQIGFRSDLPPGVTASGTTTTTITIIDDDPAITVDIGAPDTRVTEGGTATVSVQLSEDPKRPLTIPITATGGGGATSSDYSVQANVTFNSGQRFKNFTFTATGDTDPDHGESVELGFGALPPGVSLGNETTVTFTIIDDDPAVTVSFGSATYSTAEPGPSVQVTVTLSAVPQRPLRIPITATHQGGATAADFDVTAAVNFDDDEMSRTFVFVPEQDMDADHGESVRLSFGTLPPGVTASGTTRTTITIIDDDPAVEVEFGATTYAVVEGVSQTVTVTLSEDPKRPLTIPITATAQGSTTADDYTISPTEVTFASGQISRTLEVSALQDSTPDDGDSVTLGFGTDLPPGVSLGANTTSTITIIDDDPAVTVSFGSATYSADESGSVDVTLTLSEDPQRSVTIPIHAAGLMGRHIGRLPGTRQRDLR